ncbi:MAG TPA: alpha/beta hydrolase [Acidimicrobiales bacterium]|nr:alpha/beta hydrolase [Acidimicrobiales bacterium]
MAMTDARSAGSRAANGAGGASDVAATMLRGGDHHELTWHRTWLDDRPVHYASGGEGIPVVFLHGWALGHRAYKHAIARLVRLGCHVVAPSLPGFGGTGDLPRRHFSMKGYGDWVAAFLDAVDIDEPAFVVGHSFGGGVGIAFTHRHPGRVRSLVLVNSIGGPTWKAGANVRSMAERPIWDWGVRFPADLFPITQVTRVAPAIFEELVPNLLRNPMALWRVGALARTADLTAELEELKERQVPVVALSGVRDHVIPKDSFDALCLALGAEGQVVDGGHSWLLADPDEFGEVLTNHLHVAQLARDLERAPAEARRWGSRVWRGIARTAGDGHLN